MPRGAAPIERLTARAFVVPTDEPEADGTIAWSSTTMVLVEARAGGQKGLGYTYGHFAAAALIEAELAPPPRQERLWLSRHPLPPGPGPRGSPARSPAPRRGACATRRR
jgi:hypothetical protein